MCFEGLARLSRRVWRRFVRGSREISLAPSLHRASTDALILQRYCDLHLSVRLWLFRLNTVKHTAKFVIFLQSRCLIPNSLYMSMISANLSEVTRRNGSDGDTTTTLTIITYGLLNSILKTGEKVSKMLHVPCGEHFLTAFSYNVWLHDVTACKQHIVYAKTTQLYSHTVNSLIHRDSSSCCLCLV